MATLTSRGLTSGAQDDALTTEIPRTPVRAGANQDYEDISTKVIAKGATRDATTKQLAASDLKETVQLANSDNWEVMEWDPQAELVVITPDAAIDLSTDPSSSVAGAGGVTIGAGESFPLHVAGSPNGRVYIKRNAASGQPNVQAYGYGSRLMAFSSFNAFDTASTQTA